MSDYEAKADSFLESHGLAMKAAFKGDAAPPWSDGGEHGDRYRVTIKRKTKRYPSITSDGAFCSHTDHPQSISFNFWNSIQASTLGEHPSAYDVLACISSDAYCPDDFADFCGEYGYDQDSRKAFQLFKRCAAFAEKLRAFFTEEELSELAEIN